MEKIDKRTDFDKEHRHRSKTVNFRVSPGELDELNRLVRLSGMYKQKYILARLCNKEIKVIPNLRIFKALRKELNEVRSQLENIESIEFKSDLVKRIEDILMVLEGSVRKKTQSPKTRE